MTEMDLEEAMGILTIIVEENEPDWQPAKDALNTVLEAARMEEARRKTRVEYPKEMVV